MGSAGRCVLDRTFKAIPEEPNDAAHGPRLGRAPAHRTVAGLLRRCDAARRLRHARLSRPHDQPVYHGVTSDQPYDRTLEVLRASDLEVIETERADGLITAAGSFEDRGWAECTRRRRIVRDSEARSSVVPAAEDHREVELTASVSGAADGALLTLSPTFSAEPESAMATTGACTTTRVLERQILERVAQRA
jgi:hypothetical protein